MEFTLNRQTQVAISAFEVLAQTDGLLSGAELAAELGTTRHYLPQAIRPLVDAGWIGSKRGPAGGYELKVDPTTVSLLDVVEAVEGSMAGRCVVTGGPCPSDERCPFHATWSEAQDSLRRELDRRPMQRERTSDDRHH